MDTAYDDWEPPSEATMKLLQARRERSNKISKLMGDYLLKGYKMLGVTCPQCETILLQTKQGAKYCIACSELDSDADKDDPVTNQAAALAQAREHEVSVRESGGEQEPSSGPAHPLPPPPPTFTASNPRRSEGQGDVSSSLVTQALQRNDVVTLSQRLTQNVTANASSGARRVEHEDCVGDLLDKMDWASVQLRVTPSVEYSVQLCQLIKACAEAVTAVKAAESSLR